jgi:hypothetical protein
MRPRLALGKVALYEATIAKAIRQTTFVEAKIPL